MNVKKIMTLSLFLLLALVMSAGAAHAWGGYINQFMSVYPSSGTVAAGCQTCHGEASPGFGTATWNAYGIALRNSTPINLNMTERLPMVEALNSDGIAGTNIEEINAGAQPGWCNPATAGCNNQVYDRAGQVVGPGTPPGVTLDPGVVTAPNIAVSPGALVFGTLLVGNSEQKTLTIANTGDAPLTIVAAGIDPTLSQDFAIVQQAPATLAPGTSADVILSYTPSLEGPSSGAYLIQSDDPDQPLVTISLSGIGSCTPP